MSGDNGRSIYDYLVREITGLRDSLEDGYEIGVRLGGFGSPTVIFPGCMHFHEDGLINFSGQDEEGKPLEIFLSPSLIALEVFASPTPEGGKKRTIGFEVIKP